MSGRWGPWERASVLGELAGEGRRAGRAGELGCGARTCWAEREAGKELAQVWAARGGKERKTGPAGERNRTGRRERGAWVGFGTKLGWVLFYFFLLFISIFPISNTTQI